MPEARDVTSVGEVRDRKLLEDGAEDVGGGERREVELGYLYYETLKLKYTIGLAKWLD